MKKAMLRRALLLFPLPLALLTRWIASQRPDWTEKFFSTGLYPKLAAPMSRLTGLIPISVIEPLVVGFFGFVFFLLIKKRFFAALLAVSYLATVFLGGWSLNYFRFPLEKTLSIPVQASTEDELIALCEKLIEEANQRPEAPPEAILDGVEAALNAAAADWPIPVGSWGKPKPALCSPWLSRLFIAGITSPFTAEALVNGDIPAASLPYVGCHEAAHARGFAREEDANLIAYLACRASDDPYYRYSGAYSVLVYCLDALRNENEAAYQACKARLSEGVLLDMSINSAFWEPFKGEKAARVGAFVNDTYLTTLGGGDQSGHSYGRIVDLLLAIERKKGI